jgi:hypothetical protein
MATKELWEIELDIKLDKFGNAGKVYEDNVKRVIEYDKRFTASVKSEAKIREKVILQTLAEEKRANDVAFREKMQMAKQYDAALLEDFKRTQAKLKAERDKLNQPGESVQLKGDVGSAAYVSQLKAIQRELSPTSAQFKQLSETIRQYEAELNKANKSSGLMAFKNLTVAIKETKGELARLAAEQKTGTAEWQRYSDKLRELQRQKQLIQRETKLTSQQLIAMSRDLTVVAYGLRTIGQDIISLSQGKQSAGEMALAIGGIGMQVLVVLPAIHGLTKALEAAGIVSTATITKLAALSATLGTLAGGIAVVTVAYGTMIGAATHVVDIFGRIGDVLSGQMGYWEAVAENLKDVTFGLIDVTDASNNFDSSNVQQQLSDLAYIANFSANAMANLKQQVQDALSINTSKFMEYAIKNKLPESFAGPFIGPSNRPGYYDENGTWHEGVRKNKGGSPRGGKTQEKDPITEMLTGIANEVRYRELTKNLTIDYLNEQIKVIQAVDTENLKLEQKIKLLEAINQLRANELFGIKNIPDSKSLDTQNLQNYNFKKGIKLPYINTPDMRPDMTSEDFQALVDQQLAKEQAILNYSGQAADKFLNILQTTGLIDDEFMKIISVFKSVIGTGDDIFNIFEGLLSFIPGGGLVSSVVGSVGGGGGDSLPNYTMPERGLSNITLVLKNPVSFKKAFEVESDSRDVRLSIVNG